MTDRKWMFLEMDAAGKFVGEYRSGLGHTLNEALHLAYGLPPRKLDSRTEYVLALPWPKGAQRVPVWREAPEFARSDKWEDV